MDNKIAELRELKEITQEVLAKTAGISRPFLSNIENGKQKPSNEIAFKIAEALGEPIEKVFFTCSVHHGVQNSA